MKKAVCVLTNNKSGISGHIEFHEYKHYMKIFIDIKGLSPGLHGFHIHQTGDLRKGCDSLCSHFNPYNTLHGDIKDNKQNRHIGDLGNINVDSNGNAKYNMNDKLIRLSGKCNIIGRSVVIHEKEDDLGLEAINQELLDLAEEEEDDGNPIISSTNGFFFSVKRSITRSCDR